MDKKFRKNILRILKEQQGDINIASLEDKIAEIYNYKKDKFGFYNFSQKLEHFLHVFEGELLITITKKDSIFLGVSPKYSQYVELTSKGYQEFKPFRIKIWKFLKSDFLIILTIISTLLGMIGTILGWIALTK